MTENSAPVHEKLLDIAWGDMDALGHVNNARFFDYFQQARIEWLEVLDLDMKQNQGPVIVHTACTYLKPIVYPARLRISSRLQQVGRTSMTMLHEVEQNEQLMAQGTSKIVWVDYKLNKAVPLPGLFAKLKENAS